MRLLVVYGLKTADYGWLSGFYPARRIAEECEKRSVELRFLFPADVQAFLADRGSADPGRAADDTVCLIRGQVGTDTVRLLEDAGIPCANSSAARVFADDKLATASFLADYGWPTPKTSLFTEGMSPPCPFILKPRFGSRGAGVSLIENADDLASWMSREFAEPGALPQPSPSQGRWIAQEYISFSRGRDLRVFFAGGDILACAERKSADGGFLSNASTGGAMSLPSFGTDIPSPWHGMVLDIARESGLWYGTVDFLYLPALRAGATDALNLTVCEINSAPGFEALETDCGIDIAGAVIERLIRDFASPSS